MHISPDEHEVAFAQAQPTIESALKSAHDTAATYFSLTDVIVAEQASLRL